MDDKTTKFVKYGCALDIKEVAKSCKSALDRMPKCVEWTESEEVVAAFGNVRTAMDVLLSTVSNFADSNKPPPEEINDIQGFRDRGIDSWLRSRFGCGGDCGDGCGGSCKH